MIKDVKSYVNAVGKRLSQAFSMEAFGTEEQLQFWELSAEHVSRKELPAFNDIVRWMDMLYRAPVHFLYIMKDGKLVLHRRHVITENIIRTNRKDRLPHQETLQEKQFIKDFEYQLQNLEKKMEMDEIFLEHGVTAHSIGQCEHIPLFDLEGALWGIYCVGPYTKSPEQIVPKMSIVGRMLSNWLRQLDEEESNPLREYDEKIQEYISELGSGKLNAEKISQILLRYAVHHSGCSEGVILDFTKSGHQVLSSVGLNEEQQEQFKTQNDPLITWEDNKAKITEAGSTVFEEWSINFKVIPFTNGYSGCMLLSGPDESDGVIDLSELNESVENAVTKLFKYREQNNLFSEHLMDAYYHMVRLLEKSRDKTKHHTPRMVAFVQRFGMFFGLEEDEMEILKKTAALHDIGYVGATSIEAKKSIGGELSHPVIGADLIAHLSVHEDVVEGIRTHHEWVNGKGSPAGLIAEQIPWTGKIIGVFEYIVEFIESHAGDTSQTEDEWLEELQRGLMKRADVEFDMVLIPTAIQLIQALGWDGCVDLGVNDDA